MLFSIRLRYVYMLGLAGYTFVNVLLMEVLPFYNLPVEKSYVLALFVVSVVLVWEGNRFIHQSVADVSRIIGPRVHPLLLAFLLSLPLTLVVVGGPALLLARYLGMPPTQLHMGMKLMLALGFRINLFLNTINAAYYLLQELRLSQVEAEQLKKISVQAQFQSLKNQVNPHFLFNNLNVLSALLFQDVNKAGEFLQQLSKVYRYVLQNQEKEVVAVAAELEFMESYAHLLRARFRDSLRIEIAVPASLRSRYTVPAALQMLLENALKHNISSRNRPLLIEVFASPDHEQLVVRNTLQPKPAVEPSTNLGLENIKRRYGFISPQPVEVERDAHRFTVRLPLLHLTP
ncbi:sensor histidine kinase [Hymenobacter arizonensis]|uniref:Histidine kinase n=1 Tax=Hymenobacter arizonensis TaxID=1227077 RepID=A0A1I5XVX5_HYMAR|nr:histidine kinase [Hymenobacter arizonensis]SFQ36141.1 Histidine kinase [Hymenobacter arizonensis]